MKKHFTMPNLRSTLLFDSCVCHEEVILSCL